jgi:hypothetical protein
MTVHFIHVGKTGGTAIKRALLRAGVADREMADVGTGPETPFGRVRLHHHKFKLRDVPPDEYAFFCLRDPIARYISGFYSRLHKGQPRYYYEWSQREGRAFEAFPTPQLLAAALASEDARERRLAADAMQAIRHLRPMERQLGTPRELRMCRGQIVYIAKQETLARDWEQLKALLHLPPDSELPSERVGAHRRDPSLDATLDDAALSTLRHWYRGDYEVIRYCDRLRVWRGWDTQTARVRGVAAILPSPPARLRALVR